MSPGQEALLGRWRAAELRQVQGMLWRRLCFHVDGLAALSTWETLHRHGLFELLRPPGATVGELVAGLASAGHSRVNAGCLQLALRSLLNQGWAVAGEAGGAAGSRWRLSADGLAVLPAAGALGRVPALLEAAARASPGAADGDVAAGLERALELEADPAGPYGLAAAAPERLLHHLDGPLAALVATSLSARGWPLEEPRLELEASGRRLLASWLFRRGWSDQQGRPTAAAAVVALLASQYWYPLSYLETLRNLDRLFFGDPRAWVARTAAGDERHLDRELDIRFSGRVFTGPVRRPFLDQVLAVFADDRENQPEALVDVGAGDGSMLRETWAAIFAGTARGRDLTKRPLLAVAVEPSAVARRRSGATLAEGGVPHRVIDGDIASPGELAARLAALGIDPGNCLYVSKSIFHNRAFRPPAARVPPLSHATGGAFLGGDGEPLAAREVEASLVELFREWRPLLRRHGMVAIEAHTVSAGEAAALQGRSPLTALELLHGYSQQLLLEPEVHRAAARAAGLRSLAGAQVGEAGVGYVALTVDHWLAEG